MSEKIRIFDETVQTKTKILDVMLSLGDTLIEAVRVLVILWFSARHASHSGGYRVPREGVCRRVSQEDKAESPCLKLRCNYAREVQDGSCS